MNKIHIQFFLTGCLLILIATGGIAQDIHR